MTNLTFRWLGTGRKFLGHFFGVKVQYILPTAENVSEFPQTRPPIEYLVDRFHPVLEVSMGLFLKQRRCELFRVKRLQIVRLFSDADEFDGQPEFLLNRDHHAAFAR